jgi:RNA polymerase sigma-70 factor (ECF subfamily)
VTLQQTYERFRTTKWTQIRALGKGDAEQRDEAMAALISRYWPAVYAHLRSRGQGSEAAAELTQAFFAEVVLDRGLFEKAEPHRGRLRSLLLTALKRFQIDKHRRGTARGSDITIPMDALQLEDAKLGPTPPGADHVFERRWAMGLFEEALKRSEGHFRDSGREKHWELFEVRILRPAITRNEPKALAELAEPMGFASPALAAAAVQVVKRRVTALLREVVAETLDDQADVEAELAEVREYLMV